MWLIVNISTIFRQKKCFDIYCAFVYHSCKRGDARKKTRHRKSKPNEGTIPVNQRTVFSIAKKVAVDLLGHREMHARRASLPVVAPSRVPVRFDFQNIETPPYWAMG